MKDGGRLMRRGRDGKWHYVETPGEARGSMIIGLIGIGAFLYFLFYLIRNA